MSGFSSRILTQLAPRFLEKIRVAIVRIVGGLVPAHPVLMASGYACLTLSLFSTATLQGQDPFGDSGAADNPFGSSESTTGPDAASPFGGFGAPAEPDASAASTSSAASAPTEVDPDPIIRLLRETPPQSPEEMAEGLTWVVRLKRWDEVRRLLDLIAAKNWPVPQLAELADAGGESLWFRLSVDEAGLNEEQRKLLDNIVAAKGTLAVDPTWLDGWIAKLSHPQPGERRLAQLRLQAGGNAAIERLINRLLSAEEAVEPKVDLGMLAGTIAEFGENGADALKAACMVSDPERSGRVYLGIAEIPGPTFAAEVAAGLESSHLTPEHGAALTVIVQRRYNNIPTPEAIERFLASTYTAKLAEYQQERTGSPELAAEVIWRTTPDGRSVAPSVGTTEERRLEELARLAAHRLNLTLAANDDVIECAAVVLQRAYRVQPGISPAENQQSYLSKFDHVATADANFWINVFDRASQLEMHGGAVRAIQKLSQSAPGHYLMPLDFLTRLLGDARPVVRFLALEQIAASDPKQSFGGAEKSLEVALEMARLASGPQALVIGRSSDLRQAAQQQLEHQISASVITAESARSALLALDGSQPIELVLVVDRVPDQSVFELLQRLRGAKGSRSLPIAVMTDELYQHERRLIDEMPGVVSSQLSQSPEHMQGVISKLMERLDTEPFSPAERNHLAATAGDFLARIASDRDQYAFYPLSDRRLELAGIGRSLPVASRLVLLSALGSADSQSQLVTLASSVSLTAAERMEAAQAFAASVQRFGMNLARDEVIRVYDVYNALGPSDPATAKSLGAVLDAIEARAR